MSGSCFSSASSPPCGMEKGLCEKSIFFSSSFHSYIGKSTIQQNSNSSFLKTPSSLPMRMRAAPASLAALSALSQAKKTASPAESFALATSACCASGRNFAIGPCRSARRDRLRLGRPLPRSALAPGSPLEDDVAEARRALALAPSR